MIVQVNIVEQLNHDFENDSISYISLYKNYVISVEFSWKTTIFMYTVSCTYSCWIELIKFIFRFIDRYHFQSINQSERDNWIDEIVWIKLKNAFSKVRIKLRFDRFWKYTQTYWCCGL